MKSRSAMVKGFAALLQHMAESLSLSRRSFFNPRRSSASALKLEVTGRVRQGLTAVCGSSAAQVETSNSFV